MKNMNIQVMTAKIISFFTQLTIFNAMNKCKNYAKLFLCAFAIFGMTACGGSSASNNGGTDTVDLTNPGITLTSGNSLSITDEEVSSSGEDYSFLLAFTVDVSVDTLAPSSFTASSTINIVSITKEPVNGLVTEAIIVFNFVAGNTAEGTITIATGNIRNATQSNTEDIVISIDKGPRILSKTGNSQTEFNSDIIGSGISYIFNFSEAIHGLEESAFVIVPPNSGVSINTLSFNDGEKEATAIFTVAENTDGTFSIDLTDDSYTDDGGNGNSEITETDPVLPIDITIDTVAPRVTSTNGETEFNKDDLGNNSEFSYTFNFSEAVNGLEAGDFEIDPPNSGVSAQSVSFNTDLTEATVTFTVSAGTENDFSISLKANSYTDQLGNQNSEEEELPKITIDSIPPTITSPLTGDYPVTTQSFTLTIDFSETVILTTSNIGLNNVTIDNITYENSGETGRAVIEVTISDLAGGKPTLTINGSDYSDALGNDV